jgi:hypothetical protein
MAAVIAPNEMKLDIFDLLCSGGGAILRTFIYPNGLSLDYRIQFNP